MGKTYQSADRRKDKYLERKRDRKTKEEQFWSLLEKDPQPKIKKKWRPASEDADD